MKIAICGSSINANKEIDKKAFEIGKEIAKNNVLLLTGAGKGYPYEAAKGAFSNNGKVFGVSPAKNEEDHVNKYQFPKDAYSKIEFTGLGVPGRNFPLVSEADAIIIISGKIGSLNEFTIAFAQNKVIGILQDSGGVTELIDKIADVCNKTNEKENIVYSSDPKELVAKVLNKLQ